MHCEAGIALDQWPVEVRGEIFIAESSYWTAIDGGSAVCDAASSLFLTHRPMPAVSRISV